MSLKWKGTREEGRALLAALVAHCGCPRSCAGRAVCRRLAGWPAEQRALDRLLFARRLRGRWVAEEWEG